MSTSYVGFVEPLKKLFFLSTKTQNVCWFYVMSVTRGKKYIFAVKASSIYNFNPFERATKYDSVLSYGAAKDANNKPSKV